MIDIRNYNREAWNRQVREGNQWTIPVTPEEIKAARRGEWSLLLTPLRPVPREWYPPLKGARVLCLASGGGQQGPILAAAGAQVTVYDNSPAQLAQDRIVAEREGLEIEIVEGDMRDLSVFPDNYFDMIFHPVSNTFIPDARPVWQEAFRVLKPGGALLAGFDNPAHFIFDFNVMERENRLLVRFSLPYSDLESLPEDELKAYIETGSPLEFSHTLEEQIGGQLEAGFVLTGFYEDNDPNALSAKYFPMFIATRAVKNP